jgi:hypothetical protein
MSIFILGRRIEKTGWLGVDFRGIVTDKIRVNAAYRFVSFDTDINQFAPQVTSAAQINQLRTQNLVSRVQAKSLTERHYNNFNADASYEWLNNGWWKNTTQIGFYQRVLDSRVTAAQGAIPGAQSPINVYTGQTLSPLRDVYPGDCFRRMEARHRFERLRSKSHVARRRTLERDARF